VELFSRECTGTTHVGQPPSAAMWHRCNRAGAGFTMYLPRMINDAFEHGRKVQGNEA